MKEKHAAYCGTRNIYDDIEASAKSIVANSDVDKIWFVIEDDDMDRELPDMVECINMADQQFFKPDGPNMDSYYTYMCMMRVALCYILPPEVDKVLALDSDLFAVRDCSDIWDMPINDEYFAAVHEWHRSKYGLLYCNGGVVLYNLVNMRDGKADECINALNRGQYPWLDQCVASYLCQGHIYDMPAKYNDNYWTTKHKCKDTVIKHYAGVSGDEWRSLELSQKYRNMTWEEALVLHEAYL